MYNISRIFCKYACCRLKKTSKLLIYQIIFSHLHAYTPFYSAIVFDCKKQKILHNHFADVPLPPASLTKMMTILLTFDAINQGKLTLDTQIVCSHNAASQPSSKLWVHAGEKITVRDALNALIICSANDIAVALAEHIAGSEQDFVKRMNTKAQSLLMHDTVFQTATGLHRKGQYSSAKDMLRLVNALLSKRYERFYHLFSQKKFERRKGEYRYSTNKVLGKKCGDIIIDGLKTGYTYASGFNLAISGVNAHNQRFVVIVMGAPSQNWRNERILHLLESIISNKHPTLKQPAYSRQEHRKLLDGESRIRGN